MLVYRYRYRCINTYLYPEEEDRTDLEIITIVTAAITIIAIITITVTVITATAIITTATVQPMTTQLIKNHLMVLRHLRVTDLPLFIVDGQNGKIFFLCCDQEKKKSNLYVNIRLKSLLDLFAILWFIVGNYLVFSPSSCALNAGLYYYTILSWIIFGYTILVIPLFACASVVFCLPCVLGKKKKR